MEGSFAILDRHTCPVCGRPAGEAYRETPIHRVCQTCGLVFRTAWNAEPPSSAWESDYWSNESLVREGLLRASAFSRIVAIMNRRQPEPGRWLDLGCGLGLLLKEAAASGWEVVGIEPSARACEVARGLLGTELVLNVSIEDTGQTVGVFDVVSLTDVVRHVPEPLEVLRSAANYLKPGGWLVVRDVDSRKRVSARRRVAGAGQARAADYAQEFSPRAFRYAYGALGLSDVRVLPSPLFLETSGGVRGLTRKWARVWSYRLAVGTAWVSRGRVFLTPNTLALGRRPTDAS